MKQCQNKTLLLPKVMVKTEGGDGDRIGYVSNFWRQLEFF